MSCRNRPSGEWHRGDTFRRRPDSTSPRGCLHRQAESVARRVPVPKSLRDSRAKWGLTMSFRYRSIGEPTVSYSIHRCHVERPLVPCRIHTMTPALPQNRAPYRRGTRRARALRHRADGRSPSAAETTSCRHRLTGRPSFARRSVRGNQAASLPLATAFEARVRSAAAEQTMNANSQLSARARDRHWASVPFHQASR